MIRQFGAFAIAAALPLQAQFSVGSGLVLIPITVTDRRGALVQGLERDSFTVLDNGRPQPVAFFTSEDLPCSVGLVVDASQSVSRWLDREKAAVEAFLKAASPDDDYFVAAVTSSPVVLPSPAADAHTAAQRVRALRAGGWTALSDTIRVAVNMVRRSPRFCRAILVVSDGNDNHSRATQKELIRYLIEADVRVYTIGIEGTEPLRKGVRLAEEMRGNEFLRLIALNSGGLPLTLGDSDDPATAGRKAAVALHSRYIIGLRADISGGGKWHRLRIKVKGSAVQVYARAGYRTVAGLQ